MIFRRVNKFLSSAKLAIVLLSAILACCAAGVTIVRGAEAGRMIFSTLWFNCLLVLLVVNVACCFFPRMWGRKLTLVSFGMILFHLSFVVILGGIVYNSLFYFRGLIRLTEGETLPSGEPMSYDYYDHGRLFAFTKIKGETTLVRMHAGYKVEGLDKRAAYEIAVGERSLKKRGTIYITHNLDHDGVKYMPDREGYSVLAILYDNQGKEIYGAFIPLQSIKQKDGGYLYTTGTKDGPGSFPFPQSPEKPLFAFQIAYRPDAKKERAGEAYFQIWSLKKEDARPGEKPLAKGRAAVGERFKAGDHFLEVREVRYWVGMNVRYEPGKPIVLGSLWAGLGGVVIAFIGRLLRGKKQVIRDQPSGISDQ